MSGHALRTNYLSLLSPLIVSLWIFPVIAQETANTAESNALAPSAANETPPTFAEALNTTFDTWGAWLSGLPIPHWLAAFAGFLVAWGLGFAIFYVLFKCGKFAPAAARWGLWAFSVLWFAILLGLFIPTTAPWWWPWTAMVILLFLLLLVPRPRRAS